MNDHEYATIVPAKDEDGNPQIGTQGTQVVLPSGEKLRGVNRVELVGQADDIWRAKIHCHLRIDPRGIEAGLAVIKRPRLTWWQKLCAWAGGFYIDTTHLESMARELVKARNAHRD